MKTTTITYASYDDASTIRALLWEPDHEAAPSGPRGLVQLVHGMSEHVERYAVFPSICAAGVLRCAPTTI